jgi:hypothetical protein
MLSYRGVGATSVTLALLHARHTPGDLAVSPSVLGWRAR